MKNLLFSLIMGAIFVMTLALPPLLMSNDPPQPFHQELIYAPSQAPQIEMITPMPPLITHQYGLLNPEWITTRQSINNNTLTVVSDPCSAKPIFLDQCVLFSDIPDPATHACALSYYKTHPNCLNFKPKATLLNPQVFKTEFG